MDFTFAGSESIPIDDVDGLGSNVTFVAAS